MEADRFAEITEPVEDIVAAFAAHGASLFLVGGVVRDSLMGLHDVSDLDLTTDALPETISALIDPLVDAQWDQGARFGTIAAKVGDATVEITTHRAERYESDSRKPTVGFGTDIIEDLARRDFTINAMAVDLIGDRGLIDPFDGRVDLEQRRLRTPKDPVVAFEDDPLRMLRAARFSARFELVVDDALKDAMFSCAARMSIVSEERQRDEIEGLLRLVNVGDGLELLAEVGLDEVVFSASVASLVGVDWAAIQTVELKRLVLFHSLGNVRKAMRHFRYANASIAEAEAGVAIIDAILGHDRAWSDAEIRLVALGAPHRAAAVAETITKSRPSAQSTQSEAFVTALAALMEVEDLADASLPLSGGDVMELLNMSEGAEIGEALDHLRSCRIADGPMDRETAIAILRAWAG